MQNTFTNIGDIIMFYRKKNGIKQTDLAQRCNVTVSYLSQLENRQKTPSAKFVKQVAKELNITINYQVHENINPPLS